MRRRLSGHQDEKIGQIYDKESQINGLVELRNRYNILQVEEREHTLEGLTGINISSKDSDCTRITGILNRRTRYKRKGMKKKQVQEGKKDIFRIGYCNANGRVRNAQEELNEIRKKGNYKVITCVETNLREGQRKVDLVGCKGYHTRRSGKDKKGGGIVTWVDKDITSYKYEGSIQVEDEIDAGIFRQCKTRKSTEKQWVILDLHKGLKIAVGTVYLNTNKTEHEELNERIKLDICKEGKELQEKGYKLIVVGDFNGHLGEESLGVECLIQMVKGFRNYVNGWS